MKWLLPPDQSPLKTTIAYEQTAIEVTASVAAHEADPYLQQVYRFGLLEDFDHLYRYRRSWIESRARTPPDETWMEKWLLHESCEVYNYYGCAPVGVEPALEGDLAAVLRL